MPSTLIIVMCVCVCVCVCGRSFNREPTGCLSDMMISSNDEGHAAEITYRALQGSVRMMRGNESAKGLNTFSRILQSLSYHMDKMNCTQIRDTTYIGHFRNETFVTISWKYSSKPLHMLIKLSNQVAFFICLSRGCEIIHQIYVAWGAGHSAQCNIVALFTCGSRSTSCNFL